ncbi:UNVERIFIED_CONTAM: Outer envelope protein 64, chloroplastic [Sesamum radiatum]|uniref:Outer envelope protein 64, chloroplastic n=1 Tax=Sesamum radiatum TaxID=300843 RepID=A0AAW2VK23_SESRA
MDTDGGVRVPAGYCGILGFRPSHGTVSLSGVIPVSGSLDAVGWFAKDPSVLRRVGHVLLQVPYAAQLNPRNIVIADDCFQLSKVPAEHITQMVVKSVEKLYGRQVLRRENLGDYINLNVPSLSAFNVKQINGEGRSPIRLLANVMQILKRAGKKTSLRDSVCKYLNIWWHEFKQNHDEWINSVKPSLDPVILAQIPEVSDLTDADVEKCNTIRSELRSAINALLKDDGILVIPTSSDPPPKLGAKDVLSEEFLIRTSTLSSLASMSGCCQVALPLGVHEKCPVSLSLLARHGGDRFLLDTLQTVYASLQEQVDTAGKPKSSSKAVTQETSAEMAKEKGNQAFKDKQWQRAIGFYTEAIKLNSSNATYYSNRAAAYLEMGSFIQAEADCTQAIDLDKKNVKAYLRRGTAREMLGYYKEAMEDFRYALVLEPNNRRAAQSLDRLKKLFQ